MELGGVLFESKLTLFSGARTFSSVYILGTHKMTDWKNICAAFVFEQGQEDGSKHHTNLVRVWQKLPSGDDHVWLLYKEKTEDSSCSKEFSLRP